MYETSPTFDPFNDRTARDIRNSLSTALVSDLSTFKGRMVDRVARNWELQKLLPVYQDYIRQTRQRYRQIQVQLKAAQENLDSASSDLRSEKTEGWKK